MNKSYQIVWSAARGQWVVASEVAKGMKKKSIRRVIIALGLVAGATSAGEASAAATGTNAVVLGTCSTASGNGSIAINNNVTSQPCAVASGINAFAMGAASIAGGAGTGTSLGGVAAGDWDQVSFGIRSRATASGALSLGTDAKAEGITSVAAGSNASASANSTVAMGESASASSLGAVALGALSAATGVNSVALGAKSVSDRDNSLSVGSSSQQRQIIQLAKGTQDSDAVNVGQLKGVTEALGGGAHVRADGTINAPSFVLGNANLIGGNTGAAADVGSGFDKVDAALGGLNTRVTTNEINIATIDAQVARNSSDIINIDGRAISIDARTVQNTSDISYLISNLNSGTIGLVQQSAAGENLTVGKDTDGAAVDFAGTDGARKLVNVAAGTLAEDSQDAVNGSQLFATNQQVEQNTTDIANNTTSISNLDNRVTVNEGDINVLDNRVTNVEGDISTITNNINSGSIGLVQQLAAGENLTVGKDTDGAAVDFAGTDGARKLVNVAAGTLAEDSQDAVNGSQLFATNQQVEQNTTNIANNTTSISNLDNRVTINEGDISSINTTINNMGGVLADAVSYDSADHDKVSFGSVGTPVRLTNVEAGELSAESSDAVNGSQLFATNQQVEQNTTNIANNTTSISNLDNRVTVNEGNISVLDNRVTSVEGDISNLTNNINSGSIGLVQQSAVGENLTVGKDTDGVAVDFAGTDGARKLINVANGTVAKDSQDAINGGQLFGVSESIANAMGGGSLVNEDGSISAPSYTVTNVDGSTTTINNVGDALSNIDSRTFQNTTDISNNTTSISNLDNRVTVNEGDISVLDNRVTVNEGNISVLDNRVTSVEGDISNLTNNINSGSIGLVQQSAVGENLTVGKDTDGAAVDFAGTEGARKLVNVAAGTLAEDSQDAVNGSQLFATNQQVEQNTTSISSLDNRVTINEGDISSLDNRVTVNEGNINVLDNRVTSVEGDISSLTNNINSGSIGLVQQSAVGENLTVGKDTDGAAVDFAGTEGARKLINVANGTVAKDSQDAINGGQLFGVSESIANAMGGGSLVNEDGSISAPSYTVTNVDGSTTTINNVGDVLSNIDSRTFQNTTDISNNTTSISNLDNRVTVNEGDISVLDNRVTNVEGDISNLTNNINSGSIGLVQQLAAGENLTVGKDTDGAAVDFAGTDGARKLVNVAAGNLAEDSQEAVNGAQLYATNQQVEQNTTSISSLDNRVTINEGDISSLDNRVTVNEGNISVLDSRVTVNEGNISVLDSRVTTVEGDISTITNNINTGSIGLVQQSAVGENLTVGKDTDGAAVDFAGTDGARKLINVANGTVARDSQDAINGGQLFGVSESIANAMGGGSLVNEDGSISAPSYTVTNADGSTTTINNVGDALSNIDSRTFQNTTDISNNTTSISNLDNRVTVNEGDISVLDNRVTNVEGDISNLTNNINSGSIGLVQQSAAGENLTVGKDTDGAAVDFAGTNGARKLVNVAAGTLAEDSQDAVNGSQLFATNQQVEQNTTEIANNTTSISSLDNRVTINEGDISSLDNRVTVNEGDISVLDNRVTVNEGNISVLDSRVTTVEGDISTITNNINTGSIGLVQQSAAGENLTVGKDTDGAAVDFAGTDGARQLVNVAAGTLAEDSQDAVNGSQLFATNQQVEQNTTSISSLDNRVTINEGDISSLDNRVTVNEGDISVLDNRVTVNEGNISVLDSRVTTVEGDISTITNNINSGSIGLVQQSAVGENLTVGKDTDGAAVDFAGTDGARKLVNVANGTVARDSQDAINGGQLFGVSESIANAMGGGSLVNEDGSISAPSYTVTNVDGSTTTISNVGDALSNIDSRVADNSTSINAINTTINGMSELMGDAVMYDSLAHDRVSLGSAGKAVQLTNVKAGELSAESLDAVNGAQLFETNQQVAVIDSRVTNLEGSVTSIVNGGGVKYFHANSVKADSVASGADSIAIGANAVASGVAAVAVGEGAQASADGSVALGQGASDNGRGAESYAGKYSGADNASAGTLSVGNAETSQTRTISNLADGRAATDAVNLRQLDGAVAETKAYTDSKVDGMIGQMGGSVTEVTERVTKVESDVANVQNGTDGMFQVKNSQNLPKPKATGENAVAGGAGAQASGANSTAIGTGAQAKGKNSVAVGANSVAERDNSVAVGNAGAERQITHVAAGTQRTDAVNLGQVSDALDAMASATDSRLNSLKRDIDQQGDELSAGIAGAIAIASLPQPMINGGSTTAVGVGTFNGQSAVSVGVSHVSNDGKWTTKLGGSTDTQGKFSAGGSVGYNW
ncbi:autotransporter adhesin [Pseudomonas nitritireducens]|uniref:Autotransporter adhesin n=1 Tax=Pseudomonas nitroreducens TaxID=46680 RepID=A0A7W7KL54_PSENT|nr:YadA-like family protein [Pseudomonas nitritireducens]MBB4864078.1 autotransporter adhesin [Pseudomonas nitritireducens]